MNFFTTKIPSFNGVYQLGQQYLQDLKDKVSAARASLTNEPENQRASQNSNNRPQFRLVSVETSQPIAQNQSSQPNATASSSTGSEWEILDSNARPSPSFSRNSLTTSSSSCYTSCSCSKFENAAFNIDLPHSSKTLMPLPALENPSHSHPIPSGSSQGNSGECRENSTEGASKQKLEQKPKQIPTPKKAESEAIQSTASIALESMESFNVKTKPGLAKVPPNVMKREEQLQRLRWTESQFRYAEDLFKNYEYAEVKKMCETIYEEQKIILQPNHLSTLKTLQLKATSLRFLKEYNEALALHRFVYEKRSQILGPNHQDTLQAQFDTAQVLQKLGRYPDALSILKDVYELQKLGATLGPSHLDTLKTQFHLAHCYGSLKNYKESLDHYTAVWQKRSFILGVNRSESLDAQQGIAWALAKQEKFIEALSAYEGLYEFQSIFYGREHQKTKKTKVDVATVRLHISTMNKS